ncbi:MAG: hypothetical protein KDD77_21560 [Caldilineaceae bacterium]|nr:hypothetical protein [Caldilineaceae bacterium]
MLPTLPPCPSATPSPDVAPSPVPTREENGQSVSGPTLFLPAIQFQPPCAATTRPD